MTNDAYILPPPRLLASYGMHPDVHGYNAEDLQAAIAADRAARAAPRPTPLERHARWDFARMERATAAGRAAYGLCPVGCGCLWRDNLDGTMSLGMNQRSCEHCEQLPFSRLVPLVAAHATSSYRVDAPRTAKDLGAENEKASVESRLLGIGVTVNGWHVPAHLVAIWRTPAASAEAWRFDVDRGARRVRDALAELVACKELKEQIRLAPTRQLMDERVDEYARRQPAAWEAARAALAEPNAVGGAAA